MQRLRGSGTARRVARAVYPDLRDRSEVAALVDQERSRTQQQGARKLAAARREHEAQLASLRAEHRKELKQSWSRRQARLRRDRPAVSAGVLVSGIYLADRPLILFDVRGVDATVAASTLEEIAVEQVMGCSFRPMFLSDLPDASVWRRYGHLCEEVPPEAGWAGVIPYTEYLAARLEAVRADLDVRWVMPVLPSGLTDLQRAFLRRCGA